MTPDTKTKLTLIQTRNQAISEPHTKQSQFRSLHSKRVNSDPYTQNESIPIPHTEISSISTTHTTHKSISMSTLKPCHFRPVLFCVLHTWAHVPVIQQQYVSHKYEHQLVLLLTCPEHSKTPKILRKANSCSVGLRGSKRSISDILFIRRDVCEIPSLSSVGSSS